MPILESLFQPPFFLRNGHLQTILPLLVLQRISIPWQSEQRISIPWQSERLELDDGDFLDLDWMQTGSGKLAIYTHGLEGSSKDAHTRCLAAVLRSEGWDLLAWNFRSCSQELNRLARFYHSGETGDLQTLIEFASARYSQIALIGVSLGGNVILKYLGESRPHPSIIAAAVVSVPVDLASSVAALDRRWGNRIYLRRFIRLLVSKVERKARMFPDQFDLSDINSVRTFRQFDEKYTAPIHGFRDAAEYWKRSSSRFYLSGINIPTLLLNARDDPFLTPECFPCAEAEGNLRLFLEMPEAGGHAGFVNFTNRFEGWWERRVLEFLTYCEKLR